MKLRAYCVYSQAKDVRNHKRKLVGTLNYDLEGTQGSCGNNYIEVKFSIKGKVYPTRGIKILCGTGSIDL